MHAVIQAAEIGQVQELPRCQSARASLERVVYPVLDIRMLRECEQHIVFVDQEGIVYQDTHPDAAIRCLHDVIQHHGSRRVKVPQERLEIDAAGRAVDRAQSPVQGGGPIVEQHVPVFAGCLAHGIPQCVVRRRKGILSRKVDRLERRAARGQRGRQHRAWPQESTIRVRHVQETASKKRCGPEISQLRVVRVDLVLRKSPDVFIYDGKRRPPRNRPVRLYRATSWSARRVGSGTRNPAPQASTQATLLS